MREVEQRRAIDRQVRHDGSEFRPADFAWANITSLFEDYVVVNEIFEDDVVVVPGVAVAKPMSCRFNSALFSQVSSITPNPDDSTFNTMTAALIAGGEEMCEIRLPPYKIGDPLLIVRDEQGAGFNDEDSNPIVWADFNIDGRAWCQVAEWTLSDGGAV